MATEQVQVMAEKIAEGRSPFMLLGSRMANQILYALSGIGQQHFYFQAGTLEVWLAAAAAPAEMALREMITFYQDRNGERAGMDSIVLGAAAGVGVLSSASP